MKSGSETVKLANGVYRKRNFTIKQHFTIKMNPSW